MKRRATILIALLVLALCTTGAASAGDGSWGPWEPTYQGPITAPAGTVCTFAVSAEPVLQHMLLRYHYDDTGAIDGYQVTGPLVARVTNVESGASVERNLASFGTVMLNADGSYDATVEGNFLVFFTTGESPSNELLLLSGRTVLHGSATGVKTLVAESGRSEDLCATLAG